ncbi:MAG: ferredoxin [Fibrobacterota bacterium]
MADRTDAHEKNAAGDFFVDSSCIGCELCVSTAPENFAMDDDGMAYVQKQPESAEEKDASREALAGCPVEAIGN